MLRRHPRNISISLPHTRHISQPMPLGLPLHSQSLHIQHHFTHPEPFNSYPIQQKLGIYFSDQRLLKLALTHGSYLNENDEEESNERLEFLGDAVLGLAIAKDLYECDEDIDEGELTQIRSLVVNTKTLARVARNLGIGEYLLLGSGEEKGGGRNRNSNLANALEAIIGALFLDRGYPTAHDFCIRVLDDELNNAYDKVTSAPKKAKKAKQTAQKQGKQAKNAKNGKQVSIAGKHPKAALLELVQAKYGCTPKYDVNQTAGKSHNPTFTATVFVKGKVKGTGKGTSKKDAETNAAKKALKALSAG